MYSRDMTAYDSIWISHANEFWVQLYLKVSSYWIYHASAGQCDSIKVFVFSKGELAKENDTPAQPLNESLPTPLDMLLYFVCSSIWFFMQIKLQTVLFGVRIYLQCCSIWRYHDMIKTITRKEISPIQKTIREYPLQNSNHINRYIISTRSYDTYSIFPHFISLFSLTWFDWEYVRKEKWELLASKEIKLNKHLLFIFLFLATSLIQ